MKGALVETPEEAAAKALSLARDGIAVAVDGTRIPVRVETICLHGDTPGAAANAKRSREGSHGCGVRASRALRRPRRLTFKLPGG